MLRENARPRLLWLTLVGLALVCLLVPASTSLSLRSELLSWLRPCLLPFRPAIPSEPSRAPLAPNTYAATAANAGNEEPVSPDSVETQRWKAECLRLQDENQRLRAMLAAAAPAEGPRPQGLAARVLAREVLWQEPILGLDRGTQDGVTKGAGVLWRGAVAGRIVSAGAKASCLALLTHRGVSISARLLNCRTEGVLQGTRDSGGARLCKLRIVGIELHAQAGEAVVTSGLDGCFPPGCLLGTVETIQKTGHLEWELDVRPACETPALEAVYVLTGAPVEIPWVKPPERKR